MTKNLRQLDIRAHLKNTPIGFWTGQSCLHPSAHARKAWFVILIAFLWLACSDSDEGENACEDALPPEIYLPVDLEGEVELKAELSVDERVIVDENGEQVVIGMFQAYFSDLSNYEDELIDAIPFGAACVGEVGLHVIVSKPEEVGAGDTVFSGAVGGDITLVEGDDGKFDLELVRDRIFTEQGGEELQVSVSPLDQEPSFPGFDLDVIVPPEVTLNAINQRSDGSIEMDWEPADTSYFEIVMTSELEGSELPPNRLRCLVEDDGCQIIPADGVTWLMSYGTEDVSVRLKRHVLVHDAVATRDLAELDLARTLEFKLHIK
jgi:hypothetical protein